MSSAVAVTNLWASVLSLTFPALISWMGSQNAFTLYAGLNLVAFVLVFLFVPETRMRTLEELDEVFSVSSKTFIRYQVFEYGPWWVRRYFLWETKLECPQLETKSKYQVLDQEDED